MNQLLAALTTCMLTFSALEAGFYFIYNKMVDNKRILNDNFKFSIIFVICF